MAQPTPTQTDSSPMTTKDAAAFLGLKPETLEIWRCSGRYALPYIKVGRLVRYRQRDLELWLEQRVATSTATAKAL